MNSATLPGTVSLGTSVLLQIDWDRAEWFKSGQPWTPDHDKSLAENGLGHKDVIRFRTPGLTGFQGSCS